MNSRITVLPLLLAAAATTAYSQCAPDVTPPAITCPVAVTVECSQSIDPYAPLVSPPECAPDAPAVIAEYDFNYAPATGEIDDTPYYIVDGVDSGVSPSNPDAVFAPVAADLSGNGRDLGHESVTSGTASVHVRYVTSAQTGALGVYSPALYNLITDTGDVYSVNEFAGGFVISMRVEVEATSLSGTDPHVLVAVNGITVGVYNDGRVTATVAGTFGSAVTSTTTILRTGATRPVFDIDVAFDPDPATTDLTLKLNGIVEDQGNFAMSVLSGGQLAVLGNTSVSTSRTLPGVIMDSLLITEYPVVPADCREPVALGVATATDACDPSPIVSFSDSTAAGACAAAAEITRTWTATDANNNSAQCTQSISVVDSAAPALSCPADATDVCGLAAGDVGSAVATDNCDASPLVAAADAAPIALYDFAYPGSSTDIYDLPYTLFDSANSGLTPNGTSVLPGPPAADLAGYGRDLLHDDGTLPSSGDHPRYVRSPQTGRRGVVCTTSLHLQTAATFDSSEFAGGFVMRTHIEVDATAISGTVPKVLVNVGQISLGVNSNGTVTATVVGTFGTVVTSSTSVLKPTVSSPRPAFDLELVYDPAATFTVVLKVNGIVEDQANHTLVAFSGERMGVLGLSTGGGSRTLTKVIMADLCITKLPAPAVFTRGATIARQWTATDACGNTSTCKQLITIAPAFDCSTIQAQVLADVCSQGFSYSSLEAMIAAIIGTPVLAGGGCPDDIATCAAEILP